MKLHAIQARRPAGGTDKRTGDAWDLYRVLADLDRGGAVAAQYVTAPPALRHAVRQAVNRVFIDEAARTRRWLSAGDPRMRAVTADDLAYLGQAFLDALAGHHEQP